MKHITERTIRTCILTVFITVLFSFISYAAEGLIYFTDPSAETGETIDVTMTVQSDNAEIGDVNVLLKYPSDTMEFTKGTSASGGAGRIRIHGKGTKEGDNKMTYSLSFRASSPGEFTVNIDSSEVYDENGAVITITHMGSSKITVTGNEVVTGTAFLSSLEVTPGTLSPEFTPENSTYSVTIGLSVDHLTINAIPEDSGSSVSVVGNEELKEGQNEVIIYVQNSDGQLQNEYHINALKTEGGDENLPASSEASTVESTDGVQLSCKGKTITILDTGDSIEAPEGFRESQVKIDGKPVKGWISEDDTEPEYFLVYGMNDQGELNFYRYDLSERTIQRYFSEKIKTDLTENEEYLLLRKSLEDSESKRSVFKLILLVLSILAVLMLGIIIYLSIRLSSVSRELELVAEERYNGKTALKLDPEKSNRRKINRRQGNMDTYDDAAEDDEDKEEADDNDDNGEDGYEESVSDATKIMPRSTRRRISRTALSSTEDTTVIRRTSRRRRNTDSDSDDFK